jgi:predicted O-methyltransferase YrrM
MANQCNSILINWTKSIHEYVIDESMLFLLLMVIYRLVARYGYMCHYNNIDRKSKITFVIEKLGEQSRLERLEVNIPKKDLMLAITEDTGKFLNILLTSMNANNVLEIGTSAGYSTLWFALALVQNNTSKSQPVKKNIVTIDNDPLKVKRAKKNFIDAEVLEMITIIEGDAKDILAQLLNDLNANLNGRHTLFDFIFFDADKDNLTKYFDLSLPLLKKGGIIVTDNILFPEEYRLTMSNFVEYVGSNESVLSVTVPIGNGEEITVKTK